jgi:hypothetical protein
LTGGQLIGAPHLEPQVEEKSFPREVFDWSCTIVTASSSSLQRYKVPKSVTFWPDRQVTVTIFTVNRLYSQPLLPLLTVTTVKSRPSDAHSDAFFERAPQARENFALHTRPPSADVGARPSAPWHTHGCLSPPAAPRTDRPPPWPVRLETFAQATAPPLRYHVNALARPCRRLRARGGDANE